MVRPPQERLRCDRMDEPDGIPNDEALPSQSGGSFVARATSPWTLPEPRAGSPCHKNSAPRLVDGGEGGAVVAVVDVAREALFVGEDLGDVALDPLVVEELAHEDAA